MTKEFENFQRIFAQKQNESEIQTRATQKAQDDEVKRKQEEVRQKQIESDQRAAENKKIFEDAGVVKLFEEIRDTGLVKSSVEPLYESKLVNKYPNSVHGPFYERIFDKSKKLNNFTPATITWGDENKFIELRFNGGYYGGDYDYLRLDLLSNKRIGIIENIKDPNNNGYRVGTTARSSYWHHVYIDQETEIVNIPEFIAEKLIKPDHFSSPSDGPQP